jgi:hypothetical protein
VEYCASLVPITETTCKIMKSNDPKLKKRHAKEYFGLGHTQVENHFRTERSKERKDNPSYQFKDFLAQSVWKWAYFYLRSRFGAKHKYPDYKFPSTGIYNIKDEQVHEINIAVVGDWATNTADAFEIADRIATHVPEYTIHIGDTYFVGAPHEIAANFTLEGSPWVRGSKGSFAILGNHEMYGRGVSFFRDLLPTLGIKDETGRFSGQEAGYFCLETPCWRIVAVDTGYYSIGLPVIEQLPGHDPDCHLPDSVVMWLKETVKLGDPSDTRGILILSHHQYISAFADKSYLKPAEQLASVIGKQRQVIWLWGHEHKFAVYDKAQVKNGLTAYGRCIGHGGMPVEIDDDFVKKADSPGYPFLLNVDTRVQKTLGNKRFGFNGYALVKLKDALLTIEYYDNHIKLLAEDWQMNDGMTLDRKVVYQSEQLQ